MRIKIKSKQYPKIGDRRTLRKFALLPTKVHDGLRSQDYWIWLEYYTVTQLFGGHSDLISGVEVEDWITLGKWI